MHTCGPRSSLIKSFESDPNKVLLIDENKVMTRADVLSEADRLAAALRAYGVGEGDVVALRSSLCPDTVIRMIALDALGAQIMMTEIHSRAADLLSANGIRGVAYILTDESGHLILENGSGGLLGKVTADRAEMCTFDEHDENAPFISVLTAGSTGHRKAVVLSRRAVMAQPADAAVLFDEDGNDIAAAVMPLNHVLGLATVMNALYCGHGLFFPSSVKGSHILECIERYRISLIYAVPTFFLSLLQNGMYKTRDISSLRLGMVAGGPCTEEQMMRIERELGICLVPSYGMSECMGATAMSFSDPIEERACGVGRVSPMAEIRITGEDGGRMPCGAIGEIYMRGGSLMLGYYGDGRATREVIDDDGWLHTGDLGHFDERGILFLDGRKKDIIIRGGENIAGIVIEYALLAVPGVYRACVVGVPDEIYGEVPAAMVVLDAGAALTEEDMYEQLKSRLRKHEIPAFIAIADSLPLTTAGKTDKNAVKEILSCRRA